MKKSMIDRVFVGSLIALLGALVLLAASAGLAYANGSFVMDGADVVGINATPFGWAMIIVAALAVLVMIGAAVAQFVAWVGAVLNTAQLENKAWFVVLLVTGLLSFGFIAMLVYVIAGPQDAMAPSAEPQRPRTSQPPRAA